MIKWFNSPTLWVGKKKIHLIPRGSASGLFIGFPNVNHINTVMFNYLKTLIFNKIKKSVL